MKADYRIPTIGVEEEYQLVSRETGGLVPEGRRVLHHVRNRVDADVQHELYLEQIEMASPICHNAGEVERCLIVTREHLATSAERFNARLVAAGTHPLAIHDPMHVTPKARYQNMAKRFQAVTRDLLIFGLHVHVDMPDREVGVSVSNRMRAWLPMLQAISANSPFWNGFDTGYASYRREIWGQMPLSGIPSAFTSYADYQDCVQELIRCGAIDDASKIYWDARLPSRLPTLELRVCDVQTEIEQAVGLSVLMQAMVMQCEFEARNQQPSPNPRGELLRGAMWQAARFGLSESLIDPYTAKTLSAMEYLDQLREWIAGSLDVLGESPRIDRYFAGLKSGGAPAARQREFYRACEGDLNQLVLWLADATVAPPRSQESPPTCIIDT